METGKKRLRYPVGIQSFAKLRENDFVYVDKTALIYELVDIPAMYFLSRPRRFGKSLLLSTIEAYFKGRRELFKGLAIDSLTDKWEIHPVLHLDLNADEYNTSNSLVNMLDQQLRLWEDEYNLKPEPTYTPAFRFRSIIAKAYKETGKKVVILVDEYDKPLLNAIDSEELIDDYKSTLKAFYGVMKTMDDYIQFAMLTGVARFSRISIFSDLNNLKDISFEDKFASICGITNRELYTYFQAGIEELSEKYGNTSGEISELLRKKYDGYHFSEGLKDVFNPYSLINVFSSIQLGSYWSMSGTPSYLMKLIKNGEWKMWDLTPYEIDAYKLKSAGILSHELAPTLYQSGYLTISGYDRVFNTFTLDYPNDEVKESFFAILETLYADKAKLDREFNVKRFVTEVHKGKAEDFMHRLDSFIAGIPYPDNDPVPETYFQNAVYTLFTLMGFYTQIEDRTCNGRIDADISTQDYIYILEIKIDSSSQDAMYQIRKKQYWKKFMSSGKKVFLIGANFNSKTRCLDNDTLIEEVRP